MSWRPTIILLAAASVLFAFIWLVERPIREEKLRQADHTILQGFNPKSVNTIEVTLRSGLDLLAERVEARPDSWKLIRPVAYPAQTGPIMALLDSLARLAWQYRIPAGDLKNMPDAQDKYGFARPAVEISLNGDGLSEKILIGEVSAYGDEIFLQVVGDPNIYRVSTDFLSAIPANSSPWRSRSLLDLAHVPFDSIMVRSPGRGIEFDLTRDVTNHIWYMSKPVSARGNTSRINQLVSVLEGLQVQGFVTDDPKADLETFGLQASPQTPDLDLTFAMGTNMVADLQVGAALTNLPDLAFARRADPSNVVVIARDPLRAWQGAYTNFLDYHFISTPPEQIGVIDVQGDGHFTVEKESDGRWMVHASTTFPADTMLMQEWLASFTNIQTQIEATVATDFEKYGLVHPSLEYTLQANAATNSAIARIDFGVRTNGKVFERRPDELSLNYINAWDYDRLPRADWQLRDRRIWSFDSTNVTSLTIHQQGATRKYVRIPGGDWTFAPGYHGPPMPNWSAIEEGVHRLGNLRAVFWTGVGDAQMRGLGFPGADFSLTIEMKTDGKTETREIAFGGRSQYSYPYASVLLNGQRVIFEFPVDLYENFIDPFMTIPAALRYHP